MSEYFTKTFHVGWNEIDASGRVSISEYLQYVVETAWAWSAAHGLGISESEQAGLAWVIRETELSIFRPLQAQDDFELAIWLEHWRRVRGTRCFELRLSNGGELVAQGVQEIVSLDRQTLRPVPAPDELMAKIRIENPRLVPHHAFPTVRAPREGGFLTQRTVEWRDLDWLEHVNNSIYPAYGEQAAVEALAGLGWTPNEIKARGSAVRIRRMHVQHQSPASWGDTLRIATCPIELKSTGGTWLVEMLRLPEREPIARVVLDWSLVERETGDLQALPDPLLRALEARVVAPEHGDR